MKRAAWGLIIACLTCAVASSIAVVKSIGPLPAVPDSADPRTLAFREHPGARLPLATSLVDEDGRAVALGDFFSKSPVIVVLEYLRCRSLCSMTMQHLIADALKPLPLAPGRDYQLIAVSIDPRDKPADAAAARAKYVGLLDRDRAGNGMHFLTASPQAARELADAIGFPYRYDAGVDGYLHPTGFVVVAPDGMIARYVEGIAASPRELIAALADAEQNKSQDLFTRILLLCHVQATPRGRFTVPVLAAFTVANIAAAASLVGVFACIRRRRG